MEWLCKWTYLFKFKLNCICQYCTYTLGYELKLQNLMGLDLKSIDNLENSWLLLVLGHKLKYNTKLHDCTLC